MDTLKCRAKLSPRPLASSSQGHTERLPSRPAVKHKAGCRLKAAAHCGNADTIQQDPDSRDGLHAVLKTILGAAVIASAGSLIAQPASAYTADASQNNRDWKPRRHHRRLDDRQRTVDLGTRSKEAEAPVYEQLWEAAEDQVSGLGSRMSAYKEIAQQQAQRLRREYQRFRSSQEPASTSAPAHDEYTLHARRQASASSPLRHLPRTIPKPQTGLGWAVLALVVAALAKSVFGLQLPGWMRGGQGTKGGRWIKDRSLGGKMVFIPDEEVAARKKQEPFEDWRVGSNPSATAAPDRAQSRAAAITSAPAAFSAGAGAAQQQSPAQDVPDWWDPPPVLHSSGAFKEEAARRAQSLVRAMEEGKVAGRDPSLEQLVALRQTCAEMQIVVKTRTPQGRDSLLRIAADGAINAAMDQNLLMLNGMSPQRFIAGVAVDLGIPDKKAGTIANGAIAAQLARILQEVYLAIRAGRDNEVLVPLLRIDSLLSTLPLAQTSAEAAMVGDNISNKATLEERQAIFYMYGAMHRSSAGTMAALLGFNPELVLPHLDQELAKSARPSSSSRPGGRL